MIGLFAIYSATSQTLRQDGLDPFSRVNKQVVTAVLGIVLLLVMATFDYRFLKVYAGFIYGATLVGLLVLQIPGARCDARPARATTSTSQASACCRSVHRSSRRSG